MPRGAKPGERRGGRSVGTRNKATIEKALIAEEVTKRATMEGRKLGKEVLDEFMSVFAAMAAVNQPRPSRQPDGTVKLEGGNIEEFEKWARLAVDVAAKLTPYQSPTFRAVVIAPPPPPRGGTRKRFTLTIFEGSGRAPAHSPAQIEAKANKPTGGNGTQH